MGAIERFTESARRLGVEPRIQQFPEGTKTAAAAAKAIGCDVAQIVKSLVFMVDGRPVIAFTSGANRVDPSKLAEVAGASEARRASPEEARGGPHAALRSPSHLARLRRPGTACVPRGLGGGGNT